MTVKSSRKEAYLELADTGPGIPEAVRERLFEPYATTRGVDEGMGLGLAISRKILLEHGGDLELLHSSADGTTLRLSLPLTDTK
jgi:signal transduction histidine kinase